MNFEDIKNMTDEEVRELNKKLGVKVMKRYALLFGIKWGLIIGTTYLVKKSMDSMQKEIRKN